MSTATKALGVALGGIASSSQAAVTGTTTATATTTALAADVVLLTTLANQLRSDLIKAGIIKGSA